MYKLFCFLFTIFSSSILQANGLTDQELKNLLVKPSNQRTAVIVGEMMAQQEAVPKFKTRGSAAASLYTQFAPSVVLIITDDAFGSGSIISDDGLILTNWHVVEENKEVGIAFMPKGLGAEVSETDVGMAEVIHLERNKDLALLKITQLNRPLPKPLQFGKIEDIQIGLDTHAIGHPSGEYWTYTKGYISQFRPNYEWFYSDDEQFKATVIQTQTPINPGNSGGPLLNDEGNIIGVNSFMGEGEAINFAVALNEVENFIKNMPTQPAAPVENECTGEVLREFRSQNDDGLIIMGDRDCDGTADISVYTPDEVSGDRIIDYDDNQDGKIDGTIVDRGVDEFWDFSLWDTDYDGVFDLEGLHPDGSIDPSSYREWNG